MLNKKEANLLGLKITFSAVDPKTGIGIKPVWRKVLSNEALCRPCLDKDGKPPK